jgi:hypothetical protein
MTKLEWKRFWKFWKKHPFSHVEERYPVEAGYLLFAVSFDGKTEEDITDYEYMLENYLYEKD